MNQHSQASSKPRPGSGSTDTKPDQIALLWRRLADLFRDWPRLRGDEHGPECSEWREGLADFSPAQIARGLGHCQQWQGTEPPTLRDFSRLCLTEVHRPAETPPAQAAKPEPAPSSVRDRERARQASIASSSRFREPSNGDVESFEQSFHNCGLGRRWPGAA